MKRVLKRSLAAIAVAAALTPAAAIPPASAGELCVTAYTPSPVNDPRVCQSTNPLGGVS